MTKRFLLITGLIFIQTPALFGAQKELAQRPLRTALMQLDSIPAPASVPHNVWQETITVLQESHATTINFFYHALTTDQLNSIINGLPQIIKEQITLLTAYDCELTRPPDVSKLTALKTLNLSCNRLTSSPILVGLTNLKWLNLSQNQITVTPKLNGLSALETIWLSNNHLSSPPDLTGLTALETIKISHNKLTHPPNLAGLTSLKIVDLAHNNFTTCPAGVEQLKNLKILFLDGGIEVDLSRIGRAVPYPRNDGTVCFIVEH